MAITTSYKTKIVDAVDTRNTGDSSLIFLTYDPVNASSAPNIEIEILSGTFLGGTRVNAIEGINLGFPAVELPYLDDLRSGKPIPFMTFIITLTDSAVTGTVKITSADPSAPLQIDYGWTLTSFTNATKEYKALEWAYNMTRNLTSPSNPWGSQYIESEMQPGNLYEIEGNPHGALYTYMLYNLHPVYHATSSCKMGKVVNLEGKVIGVDGLRICDNSILPHSPDANPTKTTFAMCEKMADLILASN